MTESTDADRPSPREILHEALEEAGASAVLGDALHVAGLDEPPGTREEMVRFLDGPLQRALIGTLHPATATHVIETLRERLAAVDQSGTRIRQPDPAEVSASDTMATLPPPADASAAEAYDDLVTGAVHTRITPAWGVRAVDPDAEPGETIWVIVSNHPELPGLAQEKAPPHVDVVHATSLAIFSAALRRGHSKASVVVLDAEDPSVKLDRVLTTLTSDEPDIRVVLWRMSGERQRLLVEAIPHASTWLPCDAEVTPREILQLIGL